MPRPNSCHVSSVSVTDRESFTALTPHVPNRIAPALFFSTFARSSSSKFEGYRRNRSFLVLMCFRMAFW